MILGIIWASFLVLVALAWVILTLRDRFFPVIGRADCPVCDGKGWVDDDDIEPCSVCDGNQKIEVRR